MDFRKDMKCVNCQTQLKVGGMQISPPELIHWRSCPKCDLQYIIYKEHPKKEYSLYSELKGGK